MHHTSILENAIKNIQKAFAARLLKSLDDGQPLVVVAIKMK
jgi:hypothetical protein